MKSILIIGGAHIDRKGKMTATYFKGSSIPGIMQEQLGGSAYNIAANLTRLGLNTTFISPRADPSLKKRIELDLGNRKSLCDCPIMMDGHTPSYTALLDKNGDLIAALADMILYDQLTIDQFAQDPIKAHIAHADILITDGNLPKDILIEIGHLKTSSCLWYAMATSPAKIVKYKDILGELELLSMNVTEAEALSGQSPNDITEFHTILTSMGLNSAIVTNGGSKCLFYKDQNIVKFTPPLLDNIVDVTGAGDAFLSGFISGRMDGKSSPDALQDAMSASYITLGSDFAQARELSKDTLIAARHTLFS